jgi:hypothetical protein
MFAGHAMRNLLRSAPNISRICPRGPIAILRCGGAYQVRFPPASDSHRDQPYRKSAEAVTCEGLLPFS